jgi:hypothetical protein
VWIHNYKGLGINCAFEMSLIIRVESNKFNVDKGIVLYTCECRIIRVESNKINVDKGRV